MSLLSRKLSAEVDANRGPGTLSVADGPHQITLKLIAASPVGVSFDVLDFVATDKPHWSADALKAWGDRLTARLTYLMEPLVVLEIDAVGGEVELRSQSPSVRDTLRTYYEMHLRREGTLQLRRVAFDTATRQRFVVTCHLTREALDRLADDLVASVA